VNRYLSTHTLEIEPHSFETSHPNERKLVPCIALGNQGSGYWHWHGWGGWRGTQRVIVFWERSDISQHNLATTNTLYTSFISAYNNTIAHFPILTTSDPPIENTAEAHQFGNMTILEVTNLLEGWPEYVFNIPASDLPGRGGKVRFWTLVRTWTDWTEPIGWGSVQVQFSLYPVGSGSGSGTHPEYRTSSELVRTSNLGSNRWGQDVQVAW